MIGGVIRVQDTTGSRRASTAFGAGAGAARAGEFGFRFGTVHTVYERLYCADDIRLEVDGGLEYSFGIGFCIRLDRIGPVVRAPAHELVVAPRGVVDADNDDGFDLSCGDELVCNLVHFPAAVRAGRTVPELLSVLHVQDRIPLLRICRVFGRKIDGDVPAVDQWAF